MVNTLKELWRRCRIFTRRRRSIKHVRTKATIGWLWFLSHTFQEQIETRLNLHYSVWASYVACLRQTVVPAHSQKNNTQSSVILSLLKYSHWISAITISIVPRSTIRFTLTFEQSSHPQFPNSPIRAITSNPIHHSLSQHLISLPSAYYLAPLISQLISLMMNTAASYPVIWPNRITGALMSHIGLESTRKNGNVELERVRPLYVMILPLLDQLWDAIEAVCFTSGYLTISGV